MNTIEEVMYHGTPVFEDGNHREFLYGIFRYYVERTLDQWTITKRECTLQPGEQIIYTPWHATSPKDSEAGFVTSVKHYENGEITVYCRFWLKDAPYELRNKLNSEGVACISPERLSRHQTHAQSMVNQWMEENGK